jgi:HEPN domain-containing protein
MSSHELRANEAQAWLAKTLDDLECATVLASSGHGANALYHCQQAAEKALKASLTWHDQPFRKTHNLLELGDACAAIDPTLTATAASLHVLTDYAWKLRYPGDPYVLDEGELATMMALAGTALEEIQGRLPAQKPSSPQVARSSSAPSVRKAPTMSIRRARPFGI